ARGIARRDALTSNALWGSPKLTGRWKSLFLRSGSLFGEKKIPDPLRNKEMSAPNRHIGHLINTWSAPPTEPVSTSTLGPLALSVHRDRVKSRRRPSDSH